MKATVIRVSMPMEKDMLELYRKKLTEFLDTPVDGSVPQVRFFSTSEYTPEKMGGPRSMTSMEPHITATILWE